MLFDFNEAVGIGLQHQIYALIDRRGAGRYQLDHRLIAVCSRTALDIKVQIVRRQADISNAGCCIAFLRGGSEGFRRTWRRRNGQRISADGIGDPVATHPGKVVIAQDTVGIGHRRGVVPGRWIKLQLDRLVCASRFRGQRGKRRDTDRGREVVHSGKEVGIGIMEVVVVRRDTLLKVLRIVVVLRGDDPVSAFDNIVAADVEDHSLRCKMLGVLRGHGIGAGLVLDAAVLRDRVAAVQRPEDQILLICRQFSPTGSLGSRPVHIVGICRLIRVQTEHRPPAAYIQVMAVQTVHADDRAVVCSAGAGITAIDRDPGIAVGNVLVPGEQHGRGSVLKIRERRDGKKRGENKNDAEKRDQISAPFCFGDSQIKPPFFWIGGY